MKIVLFLTISYPYLPGEQFIEDEISYWASQTAAKVVLVPLFVSGIPRSTPVGIAVDLSVAKSNTFIRKLVSLLAASVSALFWKEVQFIYETKALSFSCYARALWTVAGVFRVERALKHITDKHHKIDVAYCYWNDIQAYAAVLLKRAGLISHVISRAHGFDVYENRRPSGYMPLKRKFIKEIDALLAVSNQGKEYLKLTYGASAKQLHVSPLGVTIPTLTTLVSKSNCLNIVSVSFCIPVKRIDKIIDAIERAAILLLDTEISWVHIGDGPLLSELKLRAAEKLTPMQIKWSFLGGKTNLEVKQYFERNLVDLFINSSVSEGVPVSIMEAMSYGIPVIAPNVGGISELVANDSGCLLSELPSVSEIAVAIVDMAIKCKSAEVRALAKRKIIYKYNAEYNYQALVKLVVN